MADFQSEYLRNTAVVSTVLTDRQGAAVRITDFAPRYRQFGRVFRPPQLIRMIEPVAGLPRITIASARPTITATRLRSIRSAAITFATCTKAPSSGSPPMRRCPISSEAPFVLTRPLHLVFGVDERFQDDLKTTCREFCDRTIDYWMDWSRGLSISYDWQDEIIRAAITLKLSNFEETGGIIAAHTTSIPEAPGSGRTWDYRYCWLRDAYFVVKALNRIGATQTMEDFISFTLSIASNPNELMRPVYGVVPIDPMDEKTAPAQGLSRRRAGAHRQCRGRAGAERYLRQRHPRRNADVLRPPAAAPRRRRTVPAAGTLGAKAGLALEPTTVSGNIAGASASTPIRPRCAGRAATGSPPSLRGWACRIAPPIGTPSPSPCATRCCRAPGTRSGRLSPPPSARMISTPAFCCCPISG